jgi:hypothetical protein
MQSLLDSLEKTSSIVVHYRQFLRDNASPTSAEILVAIFRLKEVKNIEAGENPFLDFLEAVVESSLGSELKKFHNKTRSIVVSSMPPPPPPMMNSSAANSVGSINNGIKKIHPKVVTAQEVIDANRGNNKRNQLSEEDKKKREMTGDTVSEMANFIKNGKAEGSKLSKLAAYIAKQKELEDLEEKQKNKP